MFSCRTRIFITLYSYRFAISNTDSDEEEIFSKGESKQRMANQGCELIQTHKAQVTTLSKKSPNMSHADWAVENMSRSPGLKLVILCNCF